MRCSVTTGTERSRPGTLPIGGAGSKGGERFGDMGVARSRFSHIIMRNLETMNTSHLISRTDSYAIRAVLFLAQQGSDRPVRAAVVAGHLALPPNYLSKILNGLARAGVLQSERGPRGGFKLARPPHDVSLADVIEPFDSIARKRGCLLGTGECSEEDPCRIHHLWRRAADPLLEFFRETTISDMMTGSRRKSNPKDTT